MLIVETYVAPSQIHGLGLFASKFIASGTKIWELNNAVNVILTEADLAELPPIARTRIQQLFYVDKNGLITLSFDGSQYINHSSDPNMDDQGDSCFALRDIAEHEEITCNYYATEADAHKKLSGF